jgi:hypothetical protein
MLVVKSTLASAQHPYNFLQDVRSYEDYDIYGPYNQFLDNKAEAMSPLQ